MNSGGAVLTVRSGPVAGLTAVVALLAGVAASVGLSAPGWTVGLTCGVVANAVVARGLVRGGVDALGPADVVTLVRTAFVCVVAALVADSFVVAPPPTALLAVTVVALVLDAVDGWVARRTRTSSFGARFDGEVDAFLILVLSVYVARSFGAWVLAIGLARYAFGAAGLALPWLRAQLPPRYWRKVVAAVQGIVLAVAAAGFLPRWLTLVALVVALGLLAESFGRDVWWLRRHRSADAEPAEVPEQGGRRGWRGVAAAVTNVLALLLVWFALVAPDQAHRLTPGAFLRIPAEGLAVAGFALVLTTRPRRVVASVVGALLGVLTVLRILDLGFYAALDRPFNLVTDRGYLGPVVDLVQDSVGTVGAAVVLVVAAIVLVALLVGMPFAVRRLTDLVARHRTGSARTLTTLVVVWAVFAVTGLQIQPGEPIASTGVSRLAVGQVQAVAAGVRDRQRFDAALAAEDSRKSTSDDLLAALRGKDVLIVFVESYGRVALEGLPSSPEVRAVLDEGTHDLRASGYSARSAFLTSPTFGGLSWLAHATLQSGLWVDHQVRYSRLLSSNRMTLSRAFGRAGWRTVAALPLNTRKWPEGERFYDFDKVYDRTNLGYAGPRFGYSPMPDQYAMSALQRLELAEQDRAPVMAQVDLTSSHTPWARIPRMVDWQVLDDGAVPDQVRGQTRSIEDLWRNPEDVQAAYARSIAYSLRSVISFVEEYGDDDLVLLLLGDHQPATVVSGHGASRDVPVTLIAKDPDVIERISGWGWHDGLRPGADAPVWPMDAFRDRFLAAYTPAPTETP